MVEEDLEGIVINIRACIVSSKEPVSLKSLNRDYETLTGSPIPHRDFGYSTLESFLLSIPSLRICGTGRDAMVEAAVSNTSKHISNLVSKQKPAKKKECYQPPRRSYQPSVRGRARGYAPRSSYAPREHTAARRYSPQSSYYNQNNRVQESLTVKVEANDKRKVKLGDGSSTSKQTWQEKYEVPPRLKKLHQNANDSVASTSLESTCISAVSKNLEENLFLGQTNNSDTKTIISPLGPSELIAAGRAKQAELAQYEQFYFEESLQDRIEDQIPLPVVPEDGLRNLLPPPVPVPDNLIIPNNINLLLHYALEKGWSAPDYSVVRRKPKGSCVMCMASVKISESGQIVKKCTSFPYEDEDENVAKGYAAKQALEELLEEEKVKLDKNIISTDKNIICDRISDIVAGVYNGLFSKTVEEVYTKKYMEKLPEDWIQTLTSCPSVNVESTLNSIILVPKDPSLEPPVSNVFTDPLPSPEPLALDLIIDDVLDVYVTHATSTCNIWFRIIGENYSEKYEDLLFSLENYYNTNGSQERALSIEEGHYYAAQSGDDWFRVCVTEVKEESKTVTAWLIDHGDNDTFPFISLYRLLPEFCTLQRQAVQCTLEGLESFGEDDIAKQIIVTDEYLIGKTLIAQINYRDQDTGFIKVTMFDTSGSDDVNVNEKIHDAIIYAKADPKLPNEGQAIEVFIGDISKRGEVYIQIPGATYERIGELLDSLGTEEISKHKLTSYRQVALNKMYLAKYSKDDNWYRAVVTATPSVQQNKIAVRFVDFGNAETVSITDMADLETLPPILSRLPPQAVRVALHNLPLESITNIEVAKLHALLLDEEKVVLIRTIKLHENPPVVEIFFKNEDNVLVSVNTTIELQKSLYRSENKESNIFDLPSYKTNLNALKSLNGDFFTGLKQPEFDTDFMAVLIVLAANPGNFIFQPMKYGKELKTMMGQLQLYYEAANMPELTKDEVVKGGLYAARYSDDNWYRVIVTEAVIGSKVPVRLCDYGDVICVSLCNLRNLDPEFHKFPFMAVKGKLAGVVPVHTDWSVEDCIRFQKLVVDKMLAAVVMSIEDNVDPMEIIVSLDLVDTSSEKDEVISEILISENRALEKK